MRNILSGPVVNSEHWKGITSFNLSKRVIMDLLKKFECTENKGESLIIVSAFLSLFEDVSNKMPRVLYTVFDKIVNSVFWIPSKILSIVAQLSLTIGKLNIA